MATTRGMLRAVAQTLGSSPGEVLARVNGALWPDTPQNMFVTCFYAVLDPVDGRLRYANAGHDLPYLHHHRGDVNDLRATGMPLGLMPGMKYEEKEETVEEGDSVLFYSDGLVEAHDPQREMFGFPRLRGWSRSTTQAVTRNWSTSYCPSWNGSPKIGGSRRTT